MTPFGGGDLFFDGDVILTGAKHGHVQANAIVEEARSCLFAMQSAFEYRARTIIVKGDYLPLINMLKSRQIPDTSVGFFVRDILSFVEQFDFVCWSFVRRGGNSVVHDLTHRQPLCLVGKVWESDVPDDILERASVDMYAFVDHNLI